MEKRKSNKFRKEKFSPELQGTRSMRVFVVFARLGAVRETTWLGARMWCRVRATIQVQCGSQARIYRVDRLIAYLSIATRDTCKAAQDMICVPRRYCRDLWRNRRQCGDGGSKTHANKNEKLLSMCDYVPFTCSSSSSCKNTEPHCEIAREYRKKNGSRCVVAMLEDDGGNPRSHTNAYWSRKINRPKM